MIAGIFLCCVAMGIALGALIVGQGSAFLLLALLPLAGLVLGVVSIVHDRDDFDAEEPISKA